MKHLGMVSKKPQLAQEDMNLLDIANAVSAVIKAVWWMALIGGLVDTVTQLMGENTGADGQA